MHYGKLRIEKVYWTTKEVSELTGVPDYTLRYWEKVVPYLQVPRNRAKNRAWRKQDIEFVKALKAMLSEENSKAISATNPHENLKSAPFGAALESSQNVVSEDSIPTIVSQEPLLEDGAMPQPVKPIQPTQPETNTSPSFVPTPEANSYTSPVPSSTPAAATVEKKTDEQARKPDHEVLLKLRSELLLAMSKLRQ